MNENSELFKSMLLKKYENILTCQKNFSTIIEEAMELESIVKMSKIKLSEIKEEKFELESSESKIK